MAALLEHSAVVHILSLLPNSTLSLWKVTGSMPRWQYRWVPPVGTLGQSTGRTKELRVSVRHRQLRC